MKYVIGDLIKMADEGHFNVIVHGCNCFNTMGDGIAVAVRNRCPSAYQADQQTKKGDRKKLGTYTMGSVITDTCDYDIINAYTQFTYWDVDDMFSYEALEKVFQKLKQVYGDEMKFGIPLIGAGLARGDWNRIEAIIDGVGIANLTCVVFNENEARRVGVLDKISS